MNKQPNSPFEKYVEVTFERLVLAHLEDAADQFSKASQEPLRLFLAARSVHLALMTALSAAMSGTDGIGAMPKSYREDWITFFEDTRHGLRETPPTRMLGFNAMLDRASQERVGWFHKPLELADETRSKLNRLTALRDWVEHPRPDHHFIEPEWIYEAIAPGVELTESCFSLVSHRLDEPDEERALSLLNQLKIEISQTNKAGPRAGAS
ncbi:hypothetical protein P7228_11330 [Altererythrobacter arenosus]|uniref:AbiV family abortive infection protein n=1 Tax=Altererythrobacter arenosus TaxID=3032592 RepID=A0ABY8FNJ3_9SPHN|nr:hypothetical protein [Altererythrobacter sp. CAU 1644]WFL76586.1 hypothetical protein P7228_11330 [Altererythrobacter sp. CAU 1644]